MKKLFLLLLLVVGFQTVASAQNVKPGRVNSAAVIELMPEADSAKVLIQKRQKELAEQMQMMQEEFQRKYAAFEKDAPTLTGVIAEQRRQDLLDLQAKLENFSRSAEAELAQFQQQVTAPVFQKVQEAIDKVCKLNLITFCIDEAAQPAFVYIDKAAFKDITPLVKKELKLVDKK